MTKAETRPSHVALLVSSVTRSAQVLRRMGFKIGPTEEWEGEGTREIYIEPDLGNPLLLMEPAKPGAYRRAMEKRGPGLHHLALDVLSLNDFLISISGSGWLLHPRSLETMSTSKTVYLARPGFPALIEVQERERFHEQKPFVTRIEFHLDETLHHLLHPLGLETLVVPSASASLTLGSSRLSLNSICNPEE